MDARVRGALGLGLLLWAASARADDVAWQTARSLVASPSAQPVRLGRPRPLTEATEPPSAPNPTSTPQAVFPLTPYRAARVRAQAPDGIPPPPAFPGVPGPPSGPIPPPPGTNPYDCGVANTNADMGGFWSRCGNKLKRCFESGAAAFAPGAGRTAFQSDHCFDNFISPVTNPAYFEDPRSLTEFRPIFIWQRTPGSNPIFGGGDNFNLNFQGRVAFTERFSLVIHKLGVAWTEIQQPTAPYQSHFGMTEIQLGPKYTFIRNEKTGTLFAGGLAFEIPVGSAKVFQDTGDLSLRPYFSFGQNFWRTDYGSFNFLNTTGYDFSVDSRRSDFVFSSFHLDYDVGGLHKIYPLVELNYIHYTQNGGARPFNFEGRDLFNFGSTSVAGLNELTAALGFRYLVNQSLQFGFAAERSVLNNNGGRHLDMFRLTFDMILRY